MIFCSSAFPSMTYSLLAGLYRTILVTLGKGLNAWSNMACNNKPNKMCFQSNQSHIFRIPYFCWWYFTMARQGEIHSRFPSPMMRHLHQFIKFRNFYHRFLPHSAQILLEFTNMLTNVNKRHYRIVRTCHNSIQQGEKIVRDR